MKLNEAETWAKDTFLRTIDQGSEKLGAPVERLCLAVLIRRLAMSGISLDDILGEVNNNYHHQQKGAFKH